MDRPDFAGTGMSNLINSSDNMDDDNTSGGINIHVGNGRKAGVAGNLGGTSVLSNLDVSEEDTKNLSESIKKLSGAAEQISKMAELTEATQKYLEQLSGMSENMERFSHVTNSLTNVSDTHLLNSYKSITDNSDGINQNSRGYVQQMEMLNRNISGLNTIYEIQLKSISSQIESIEHINGGLNRIREMYDGSVTDSSGFPQRNGKDDSPVGRTEPSIQPPVATGYDGQYGSGNRAPAACPQPQQPNYQQQQPNYQQPYQQQPYGYQQQAPYTNNPDSNPADNKQTKLKEDGRNSK